MATTNSLNTKQLQLIFGVTHMTILAWRNPAEGARKTPLPFKQEGRNITFNATKVKAWANKNGQPMEHDPLDVAEGLEMPTSKPGPKAGAAAKKKVVARHRAAKRVIKRAAARA